MIKSLSLSNFKSFGEEQILPLAPLTLIFGKNSSGKSSVIQSLLFIKQSFENILEGYPPRLVGDDVDLLSIKHTLHSQGKDISKNTIKIGILLSESFNTGLLTRRVNRRAMNPVRLPTIPLGMTFGWTWDHTVAAVSNSTWEVLIDDHNPAVFSGNLGNRIDVPKTYDKSSKYIHATYKAYGKLLSHAHKKNINDWIAVFNREDLQNFRTCMSRLNPVEAERTRTQISYLRWVNPELMHRFESQVSGSPLSLDEILSACFTKWFNITTNTNNKDSINFKSTNDDNQEETPPQDIDDGVTKTLGPQLKKESVIQESNLSNTEIIFEDIYTEIPIYLKDYFLTIHDSFDWYTEQYNIIHFDNFEHTRNSVADEIIRYATMSDALGMAVNPEVGDFLSVTPVHWTASASRSLDRLFSSLRHVTPVRDQLQRAYLDAAASTPVQSTESSSRPRYGRMRPTGSASDERAASSLAVFRASLRDADTRDLVNRALAQLEIPYEIIINREPVRAHEGIITESIILRDIHSDIKVGIPDVGYGVGQVIPLIISINSLNDRLLVVEQPELHLHPGLQAHLGELLVEACQRFPNGQIIAETHSEHLILRVLKLIRTGKIPSDMISVLYIDRDNMNQAKVTKIGVDDRGEFTIRWPRGFFRERLLETID